MNDRNHMYAEPEQESDEAWLKRVVFELTGVESSSCESIVTCSYLVGSVPKGHIVFSVAMEHVCARKRELVLEALQEANRSCVLYGAAAAVWPLKASATGSADSAKGNSAAPVRSESTGVFGSAQPVAEAICSDCRAPCTGTLCVYCSLRSSPKYVDSAVAERTAALPGQVAARERVAAFERRSRPRKSTTARELEREHPWSNAEDFEP